MSASATPKDHPANLSKEALNTSTGDAAADTPLSARAALPTPLALSRSSSLASTVVRTKVVSVKRPVMIKKQPAQPNPAQQAEQSPAPATPPDSVAPKQQAAGVVVTPPVQLPPPAVLSPPSASNESISKVAADAVMVRAGSERPIPAATVIATPDPPRSASKPHAADDDNESADSSDIEFTEEDDSQHHIDVKVSDDTKRSATPPPALPHAAITDAKAPSPKRTVSVRASASPLVVSQKPQPQPLLPSQADDGSSATAAPPSPSTISESEHHERPSFDGGASLTSSHAKRVVVAENAATVRPPVPLAHPKPHSATSSTPPRKTPFTRSSPPPKRRSGTSHQQLLTTNTTTTTKEEGDDTDDTQSTYRRHRPTNNTPHFVTPAHHQHSSIADVAHNPAEQRTLEFMQRTLVMEDFLKVLCSQQYHGKVERIGHVRILPQAAQRLNVTAAPRRRGTMAAIAIDSSEQANEILETERVSASCHEGLWLTSALQLTNAHSRVVANTPEGQRVATFAFCEVDIGSARFVQHPAEVDAALCKCDTVFVTGTGAFSVAKSSQITPIALLDVVWSSFADSPAPKCSIHDIELQLYEPATREMLCALCTANDPRRTSCVVLNDLVSSPASGALQSALRTKLLAADQLLPTLISQHNRSVTIVDRKRTQVELQFSLVQSALDAKRKEVLSLLQEHEEVLTRGLNRSIVDAQEARRHYVTALDQLATQPKAAQLATIASSLSHEIASTVSAKQTAAVETHSNKRDEAAVRNATVGDSSIATLTVAQAAQQHQQHELARERRLLDDFHVSMEHILRAISEVAVQKVSHSAGGSACVSFAPGALRPAKSPTGRSPARHRVVVSAQNSLEYHSRSAEKGRDPRRHSSTPARTRSDSPTSLESSRRSPYRRQRIATIPSVALVPHSSPSFLVTLPTVFNLPLTDLISKNGFVEWKLRVDDQGDYVAVGAFVGEWKDRRNADLTHCWIAPTNAPRVLRIRVCIAPHGHAKLTVHDSVGRQLDDNRVNHWNTAKPSFPQISFGNRPGKVTLLDAPHQIPFGVSK